MGCYLEPSARLCCHAWRPMKRSIRVVLLCSAAAFVACGQNPDSTENARGFISGVNVVLAMTVILIVVAGAIVVGAIALDRAMKARRALAEAPAAPVEEDEDETEVVAGIAVGRAPVPRWLYGVYVVIPVFALLYVLNAVTLAPKAAPRATATAAPTGPVTKATVVGVGIKFNPTALTLKANSPITIEFQNKDTGVPHNFTVWPDKAAAGSGDTGKAMKAGSTINGVKNVTETFRTGPPGSLYFDCTIHPTSMFGTITVI